MRELKTEKIRDMTEEEITTRVRELHEEIFNLRFRNAMRQLQNPLLIRERRRDIARLQTILTEHRSGIRKLSGHTEHAVRGEVRETRADKPVKEPKAVKEPKPAKEAKRGKEPKKAKESRK